MTIDPGGSGGSRTRKPFPSIRTTRTLLLAGGLVVTPPGVATMVAAQQTSAAVGSAPSATADTSNAAQRSQKADQAVSQLPAASTDPSGAAQRLQGADDGVSQLLNEVPAYLPHTYHSALTAPGSDTLKALPQADLPQELPLTDAQQSVSQSDSQQAVPLASKKPPPPQSLSCRSTNVYDRGAIPVTIPQREADRDPAGCEGSFQPAGAAGTAGNAFFASLGTNGRTCATCHQPPSGMSVSVANIEARYKATHGTDAIFAGVDGANCPSNLPPNTGDGAAFRAAHSLVLQRGAFRIFLPVPVGADYTATVVSDPNGCNTDPSFSQDTVNGQTAQMVSVYRRPRISANLKFIEEFVHPQGTPPNGPAIMWDTREPTLASQARSATLGHAQALSQPTTAEIAEMVAFEKGFFSAQSVDTTARDLAASGAKGGPEALAAAPVGNVGFTEYSTWAGVAGSAVQQQRAAIARGEALFNTRQFTISNVAGLNNIALTAAGPSNAVSGTCSTCHSQDHSGNNLFGNIWTVDIGVGGGSSAHQGPLPSPVLPVFTFTCTGTSTTPFNGKAVTTNDPGLALVSGKCADIGRFSVPQLRALSSHAPYFSDGSANSPVDVVQFYDRRFSIGLTPDEKQDLVDFLNAL